MWPTTLSGEYCPGGCEEDDVGKDKKGEQKRMMIPRMPTLAYSVEKKKKPLSEYTDDELRKRVCTTRYGECQKCVLLDTCGPGREYIRRGLDVPKPDAKKRRRAG